MTKDSLDLLVDFRSEISAPDEATTRRIYQLSTAAPRHPRAHRLPHRSLARQRPARRVIGLSAAVAATLVLGGVLLGLTLSAAAPASAYAAAKQAIAATSSGSIDSGTMTMTHGIGNHTTNQTTQWNGEDLSISGDHGSLWGASQVLLIGGAVYVQELNGAWLRYADESDAGRFATALQTARADVAGSNADQILALVPNLQQTAQPDGSTVYTGTIPASDSAQVTPTDNTATRLGARLQSVGRVSQFKLVVNSGVVSQMSETADDGSASSNTRYTQLGSTPPITPPASYTEGAALDR
jgi:hypothetical protein